MNEHCEKDCKYKEVCKLDEEKTKLCKVDLPPDNLIMGYTFDQIQSMQHKRSK